MKKEEKRKFTEPKVSFREKVFAVVRKIPKGEVITYGEVARLAGSPRACRGVGAILRTNHDPKIPCHRVIRSDGELGGYNRGVKNKLEKLKSEKAF
jgi:O-6-methylguanine DNA methyltransferase